MSKKFISLLILLLLIYNTSGYYLVFLLRQIEAKEEAFRKIASDLSPEFLDSFTFSKSDFTNNRSGIIWDEEGKEFWLNDNLYDVVRISFKGENVNILCVNDSKEENIIKNFSKHIRNNSTENNKVINLFTSMPGYFYQEIKIELPDLEGNSFCSSYNVYYKSFFIDIISPPPRFVFQTNNKIVAS